MGSCVSQCSRQDIIHQQSASINDRAEEYIQKQNGAPIDEKDFESRLSEIVKEYAAEIKDEDNNSPTDVAIHPTTEQFSYEIRALREQLLRSQVLFSYLLRDPRTVKQKSTENQYQHDDLLEGPRFGNPSNISSGSYASHRSTPMHTSFNSLSCPQLPSATQAESSIQKKDDIFKHSVIENICEIHEEPENDSGNQFLRSRTDSFLAAVSNGNPKLVEAETHEQLKEEPQAGSFVSSNGNKGLPSEKIECVFPRKLSILLEEDYEDASGNHFSIRNSQPFSNRKRKVSPLCNAKTQTDLSLSINEPSIHKNFSVDKRTIPENVAVREICQPRHGYSIVAHAVQKRTVYSEELPQKLVTRYPPPYTSKFSKSNYMSSDHIYFKELYSRPKTQIYKWATVAESLPSKSESFQYFTHKSCNDPNLQTRHLSLEKQESYSSSCDHSLYPESQMSSVTDCSGWMTKSDIDINLHPECRVEPPSYVQSMLSTRWHQPAKNRQENLPKMTNQICEDGVQRITIDATKSEKKIKESEDVSSNVETKEKIKSQRSMRRGSGAGASDNSQLSIPRYPAFDFSEQEDVQSLLQSPSDLHSEVKTKVIQEMQNIEAITDTDHAQKSSVLHSKDASTHKKRETTSSKTLMPELMENSETESAKGSFECEVPYAPPAAEVPSSQSSSVSFPSLISSKLTSLSLNECSKPLPFDEKEIEANVSSLALRFKTDAETLQTREERQKLKRDVAEENVDTEIDTMRDILKKLNSQATTEKTRDMILSLQNHVDVVQKVTSSVSRESETYGAVQQEVRTSGVINMLLQYVTHLKQVCDNERNKLEKTRRLLTDRQDSKLEGAPEEHKKTLKTLGITVQSIKSFRKPIVKISES